VLGDLGVENRDVERFYAEFELQNMRSAYVDRLVTPMAGKLRQKSSS
jgi:hypothetical protein